MLGGGLVVRAALHISYYVFATRLDLSLIAVTISKTDASLLWSVCADRIRIHPRALLGVIRTLPLVHSARLGFGPS